MVEEIYFCVESWKVNLQASALARCTGPLRAALARCALPAGRWPAVSRALPRCALRTGLLFATMQQPRGYTLVDDSPILSLVISEFAIRVNSEMG